MFQKAYETDHALLKFLKELKRTDHVHRGIMCSIALIANALALLFLRIAISIVSARWRRLRFTEAISSQYASASTSRYRRAE
jgi:hypothetical protein